MVGSGELNLVNSTVSGNQSTATGAGIYVEYSRAYFKYSTISDNAAFSGAGGIAASTNSTLIMLANTLSGNSASGGGGISATSDTRVALFHNTVTDNVASGNGGGLLLVSQEYTSLVSNIVSGNTAGGSGAEIAGPGAGSFVSANNLFGSTSVTSSEALFNVPFVSSNIMATSNGNRPTALSAILKPLADNGGPTLTHALDLRSPAIDGGNQQLCSGFEFDQRGERRGSRCDIGSFEAQETDCFVIPTNGGAVTFCL